MPTSSNALLRRAWGTTWRMSAATLVGVVAFGASLPDDTRLYSGVHVLDVVLGLLAISLVPLRRRAPLLVALTIAACAGFSAFASGAVVIAVVSLSTRRRWQEIAAVVAVGVTAAVTCSLVLVPVEPFTWWGLLLAAAVVYGTFVVTGLYIGGRRELLVSLHERAESAEREQAARVDQARTSERTRIAREMHDVLAHRISLVAMHAGVLTYRDDLTRDETAQTAEVIRDNARRALTELRGVLGVLHDPDVDGATVPDRPQPTLTGLDELLDESTAAGSRARCELSPEIAAHLAELPAGTSRTGFRIVQESLTNARKHAPGQDVLVELGGRPGDRLTLVVGNALAGPATSSAPVQPKGSGLGLVGLAERARLAGGELSHGLDDRGLFVVRVWVPWPT